MSLQLIEAAKLLQFDPATGWPDKFTVNQAIALQTWQEGITVKAWGAKADDLRRLFHLDHGKGNVKVTTTSRTETREWSKDIEVTFASVYWDGVPGKRRTVRGVKDVEVKTDYITTHAFAAWLAANEIEPSRHVAAWFKAMGANTGPTKTPIDAYEQWDTPLPKLPLNCELFELTEAGAAHWLAMDAWTIEEAALLLSGANPKRISEFAKDPNVVKPDFESCGYVGNLDRLTRAMEVGVLSFLATPSAICEWAAKRQSLPIPLRKLVAPTASHVDDSAPTCAAIEKPVELEWKGKARAEAHSIIERDRKKDLYPSQENIADEIAKKFRRDEVRGPAGKPLTGSYIKRHALKGISSAQGKQFSTTVSRGK